MPAALYWLRINTLRNSRFFFLKEEADARTTCGGTTSDGTKQKAKRIKEEKMLSMKPPEDDSRAPRPRARSIRSLLIDRWTHTLQEEEEEEEKEKRDVAGREGDDRSEVLNQKSILGRLLSIKRYIVYRRPAIQLITSAVCQADGFFDREIFSLFFSILATTKRRGVRWMGRADELMRLRTLPSYYSHPMQIFNQWTVLVDTFFFLSFSLPRAAAVLAESHNVIDSRPDTFE